MKQSIYQNTFLVTMTLLWLFEIHWCCPIDIHWLIFDKTKPTAIPITKLGTPFRGIPDCVSTISFWWLLRSTFFNFQLNSSTSNKNKKFELMPHILLTFISVTYFEINWNGFLSCRNDTFHINTDVIYQVRIKLAYRSRYDLRTWLI